MRAFRTERGLRVHKYLHRRKEANFIAIRNRNEVLHRQLLQPISVNPYARRPYINREDVEVLVCYMCLDKSFATIRGLRSHIRTQHVSHVGHKKIRHFKKKMLAIAQIKLTHAGLST